MSNALYLTFDVYNIPNYSIRSNIYKILKDSQELGWLIIQESQFDKQDLLTILSLISQTLRYSNPTVVGIDGMAGAGKSTLVSKLRSALKSTQTVELDDFYRPATKFTADPNNIKNTYDQYFDWNRLISTVLAPIQNGFESRYMKFDWNANKFNEEEKELYPNSVIFIDGVYAIHPNLRPYLQVKIYVETPEPVRSSRILGRNYEDSSWYELWKTVENWYIDYHQPDKHADIIVAGY